jgi:hypothetical protein
MNITRGTATRADAAPDAEEPELDASELEEPETDAAAAANDADTLLDAGPSSADAATEAGDGTLPSMDAGLDAASTLDAAAPDGSELDAGESDAGESDAGESDAATADADSELDAQAQSDASDDGSADAALEAATPVLIDFEGLTGMGNSLVSVPLASRLSDYYLASTGAVFRGDDAFVGVVQLGRGHATSGVNGIGSSNVSGALSYSAPIRIEFFAPGDASRKATTNFVSIRGDNSPASGSAMLVAFDVSNVEVGRVSAADSSPGLTLSLSVANIQRVEISTTMPNIAFDDLQFNPVTPLP